MKLRAVFSFLLWFGISPAVGTISPCLPWTFRTPEPISMSGMANLPRPRNVRPQTLNTDYILKWDWDQTASSESSTTFTAQSLAKYKVKNAKRKNDWKTVCECTSEHHCDFTGAELYYLGMWLLRVRAQNESHVSSWVQIEFCPDRDAAIGPPSAVEVKPVKGMLEVAISDPLTSENTSMKDWVKDLQYIVQYWKDPLEMQKKKQLVITTNLVTLPDLETWTVYCVRVQSRYDFYNKSSTFSPIHCEQTEGQMPYWQIFLYFLLSLAVSFLLVLGLSFCFFKSFKAIKNTFYPSIQLPTHIQEYLCDSPGSDMPHLLTTESEVEICCDRLDILAADTVATDVVMEIHNPPQDSEQDSRNHIRHSSGDSGVYSTEEGTGASQALKEGEKVKLEKIGAISFHREREAEQEQRIQDACV
ncbi:interleukin-10 receptor subunit beta [Astyanax mexicanus]|uniref:interleukin-10 receptor subunit beta n=1 Tax=Astyanax mexicanus TaxID=7994 RepID=UPI0020CB366C|nr:interleukin-10 receptor subunit beta [Astyanax mexicanus]